MVRGDQWQSLSYSDFNRALVRHSLRSPRPNLPVSRIFADPLELAKAVGADAVDADEVTELFVRKVKSRIPSGTSLDGYCLASRWRPSEGEPPPFFALLWFTCLVAQGYPQGVNGFHRRLQTLLGKSQSLERLNEAWELVAHWTEQGFYHDGFRPSKLVLPKPCTFRTNIGRSWFLSFPNASDRTKLHGIFSAEDFDGEEPAVDEVLDGLRRYRRRFSSEFQEYLQDFEKHYAEHHTDVRKSPFWIAIRREVLREDEREPEAPAPFTLLGVLHDGGISPVVGIRADTVVPSGLEQIPLPGGACGDFTHALCVPGPSRPEGFTAAVRCLLSGELKIPKAIAKQLKRGAVVFDEVDSPLVYSPVAGTVADGAEHALVTDAVVSDFRAAFGGRARKAGLEGWQTVVGARIDTKSELPPNLRGFRHLRRTEGVSRPRLVGGIRTGSGFLAMKGHLPRVRWSGATEVHVSTRGGKTKATEVDENGDILLPDLLVSETASTSSSTFTLLVFAGGERRSIQLELETAVYGHRYHTLPDTTFILESARPTGSYRVEDPERLPNGIEADGGGSVRPAADEKPFPVSGIHDHGPALRVRDAIAAMAKARSDLRRSEIISLFETQLHADRVPTHVFFDMLRAYQEMGLYDIAFRIGWREARVIAREPRIVLRPPLPGSAIEATLFGLSNSRLDEKVVGAGRRLGIDVWRAQSPWSGLIGPLRMRAESPRDLEKLSEELSLSETTTVPMDELEFPFLEKLLDGSSPPGHHRPDRNYDFDSRAFKLPPQDSGSISVQRRKHDNDHTIYVLMLDGKIEGWSYWRHIPLLLAHQERADAIFTRTSCGIRRNGPGPALPLIVGRLATLFGVAPPGVATSMQGWGYAYPHCNLPPYSNEIVA